MKYFRNMDRYAYAKTAERLMAELREHEEEVVQNVLKMNPDIELKGQFNLHDEVVYEFGPKTVVGVDRSKDGVSDVAVMAALDTETRRGPSPMLPLKITVEQAAKLREDWLKAWPGMTEFMSGMGAEQFKRTSLSKPVSCSPGCPGYFLNHETEMVERCDDCGIFEDDRDAAKAYKREQAINERVEGWQYALSALPPPRRWSTPNETSKRTPLVETGRMSYLGPEFDPPKPRMAAKPVRFSDIQEWVSPKKPVLFSDALHKESKAPVPVFAEMDFRTVEKRMLAAYTAADAMAAAAMQDDRFLREVEEASTWEPIARGLAFTFYIHLVARVVGAIASYTGCYPNSIKEELWEKMQHLDWSEKYAYLHNRYWQVTGKTLASTL
jgi:hypothetical protein